MLQYDFDKLKIISEKLGNWVDIKDYEPDDFIRRTEYPHVTEVKKDVIYYENIDSPKNPIVRTLLRKKLKASKPVLERYLNWKPFGQAVLNKQTTTICDPIFIEQYNNLEENIVKSDKKNILFGTYKPKISISENKPNKTGLYKPSLNTVKKIKDKTEDSLIIKNFPTDITRDELEEKIYDLFSSWGKIRKITLLTNQYTGQLKDIGFIDFCKSSDVINILESNERFIINNLILTLEKNKKNSKE